MIVCEQDPQRREFINRLYPGVFTVGPEEAVNFVREHSDHGGADVVLEVAGGPSTFQLAWQCARPNAIVTVIALYDEPQILPLPEMYGKNLIFKTGGVDGLQLPPDTGTDRPGKDRYHSADHPYLSPERD